MKVKTCGLTGDALDWAVGKAAGLKLRVVATGKPGNRVFENIRRGIGWYCPSQSWVRAGEILEREGISIEKAGERWAAIAGQFDDRAYPSQGALLGPTPQIAVCRCYVASKLGDEVEVPDELCA